MTIMQFHWAGTRGRAVSFAMASNCQWHWAIGLGLVVCHAEYIEFESDYVRKSEVFCILQRCGNVVQHQLCSYGCQCCSVPCVAGTLENTEVRLSQCH